MQLLSFQWFATAAPPSRPKSNHVRGHLWDDIQRARAQNRPYLPSYRPIASAAPPLVQEEGPWPYDNPDSRNKDGFILHAHNDREPNGPHFPWKTRQRPSPSMGPLPIYNETHTNRTGEAKWSRLSENAQQGMDQQNRPQSSP